MVHMAYFYKLRDFEKRFDTMSVEELKRWKVYWTQHAQRLVPKIRKQAMKRVYEIEKAIERKSGVETDNEPMPRYVTGEQIKIGDTVRIGAENGMVVITKDSPTANDIPEGVMLIGAGFDRMHTKFGNEDLVFIGRKQ